MLLNYSLLKQLEVRVLTEWQPLGVFLLLVSTLIVHQSIPHYPLVVNLVVKDDITTKQNAPTQLSEAGLRQNILGGVRTLFQTQCWSVLHPAGTP